MKRHPYVGLQDCQFWKSSFGDSSIEGLDPVSRVRFTFDRNTKIVAAGSCFAQHVARHIQKRGYNFLQSELPHSIFSKKSFDDAHGGTFNYDSFSARYGNLYTARQLRQLIDRSYGRFSPISGAWQRQDGMFVDPFRPQVEPDGYVNPTEVALDRLHHLAAVQSALENADVFIFTLGLTEAWLDKRDGAVFPVAPGVAGGVFDPSIHEFRNFTVAETVNDMLYSVDQIKAVNPDVRVLLTVSPVPLNATYEPRHVLQSTVYSKSVLRVAAQELIEARTFVDYFPSYEIITSPQARGRYFANDMRTIEDAGVNHVMDVFFSHYARDAEKRGDVRASNHQSVSDITVSVAERQQHLEKLTDLLCDEEAIDNGKLA
jgi:hypothetical protein